jgi:hypothetical protein
MRLRKRFIHTMLPYMLTCRALAEKLQDWLPISAKLGFPSPLDLRKLSGHLSKPTCSLLCVRDGPRVGDSNDALLCRSLSVSGLLISNKIALALAST